jgi:hypothetical protein
LPIAGSHFQLQNHSALARFADATKTVVLY